MMLWVHVPSSVGILLVTRSYRSSVPEVGDRRFSILGIPSHTQCHKQRETKIGKTQDN
jgi:hypothetical protein